MECWGDIVVYVSVCVYMVTMLVTLLDDTQACINNVYYTIPTIKYAIYIV